MTKLLNTLVYVQGGEKVVTANNSYGGQTLILGNLTVSYAGQNTTVTGAATIAPNATLSFTATAATGYTLPSEIAVTIDGATATVGADYTWDSASGVGQILANKIVGNVVVTVVGVASGGGGGYSVTVTQSISGAPASFYYSTDDGANWIILNAETLTNITQIKFRIDGTPTFVDGYLQFNGNTIVTGVWRDTAYSTNIIVTENSMAYCYATD